MVQKQTRRWIDPSPGWVSIDHNIRPTGKAEVITMTTEKEHFVPVEKEEADAAVKKIGSAMNTFLGSISQESRVIFLRRYWFCDTVAEIAQRYGIRESKVRKQLFKTRKQWANYLKREDIGAWTDKICIWE